jgi:hypothetical protein
VGFGFASAVHGCAANWAGAACNRRASGIVGCLRIVNVAFVFTFHAIGLHLLLLITAKPDRFSSDLDKKFYLSQDALID